MADSNSFVTIVATESGLSETLPVSLEVTTVGEIADWSKALFGLEGNVVVFKDGRPLTSAQMSLAQAGVRNGDMLAVQRATAVRVQGRTMPTPMDISSPQNSAPLAAAGGLDFSNLLQNAAAPSSAAAPPVGGLDFSNLIEMDKVASAMTRTPVYYEGMNLNEALQSNPNPENFITLLQSKDHLLKELNYHNPGLAEKLKVPFDEAVKVWRKTTLQGGMKNVMSRLQQRQKEDDYRRRLEQNPNDEEASNYFAEIEKKKVVAEQYQQMQQEYPESLGQILMLYVEIKVNGHSIQAFVDSGAQMTNMTKRCAERCGLLHLLDDKFAGMAVGVGSRKILGRIHIVQMQIADYYFPCTITILDDVAPAGKDVNMDTDFLLGLDMLKRHTCSIDLEKHVLKFRLGNEKYLEAPFLHEKDLDKSKGGTRGFDVEKANQEVLELQRKHAKEDEEE